MKKILIIVLCCYAVIAKAQTIPNGGFETWMQQGPFLAPADWNVSPGVKQITNAHSGVYAMECKMDTFTNPQLMTLDTISPNAYTGAQTMGPPMPGTNLQGYAFAFRPDSLIGWYMFQSSITDSFSIRVTLSKWNAATNARETVGDARFENNLVVGNYTRFSIPLQYLNTNMPDSALVQIGFLRAPGSPKKLGASITVDDLSFVNIPTSSGIAASYSNQSFSIFPNPATQQIEIKTATPVQSIEISNLMGQVLIHSDVKNVAITNLSSGLYLVKVLDINGKSATQKLVVSNQ